MSLLDQTDLVEIAHPDFAGQRLIACFNPLLAEERARKRPELLAATEKQLEKIGAATLRPKRPLRGKQNIGCGRARVSTSTKWASTSNCTSKTTVFPTNAKWANIEREQSPGGARLLEGQNLMQMSQVLFAFYSCSMGWGEAPLV
jgi:hypothetical protein